MSTEKDLVKAGLGVIDELVEHADLPGGPITNEILAGLLQWGKEALDAHETPQLALEAIRSALSTYGADAARSKFG